MRIFICSNRKFLGNVGGGGGVNYRLAAINSKNCSEYEMINVFCDSFVDQKTFNDIKLPRNFSQSSGIKSKLKTNALFLPVIYMNKVRKAKKYLNKANEKYHFCDNDVYYFHDLESAIAFKRLFSYKKTILVYHHQGSIYNEWSSDTGRKSDMFRKWINRYQIRAFNSATFLGFPSNGARNSLIESEPNLKSIVEQKKYHIFYNGMNCNITSDRSDPEVAKAIDILKDFKGYKIISVSVLNEAKGVDRIPTFLNELKNNQVSFKWILVGKGVKSPEIEEAISSMKISDNVIWFRSRVKHNDVLKLMQNCDFYLMLHRYSIFDFATVEAMSCGCIPILSSVGGNKEVVFGDSGLLIENVLSKDNGKIFVEYTSKIDIEKIKDENKAIQNKFFSDRRFYEEYVEFAKEIGDVSSEC